MEHYPTDPRDGAPEAEPTTTPEPQGQESPQILPETPSVPLEAGQPDADNPEVEGPPPAEQMLSHCTPPARPQICPVKDPLLPHDLPPASPAIPPAPTEAAPIQMEAVPEDDATVAADAVSPETDDAADDEQPTMDAVPSEDEAALAAQLEEGLVRTMGFVSPAHQERTEARLAKELPICSPAERALLPADVKKLVDIYEKTKDMVPGAMRINSYLEALTQVGMLEEQYKMLASSDNVPSLADRPRNAPRAADSATTRAAAVQEFEKTAVSAEALRELTSGQYPAVSRPKLPVLPQPAKSNSPPTWEVSPDNPNVLVPPQETTSEEEDVARKNQKARATKPPPVPQQQSAVDPFGTTQHGMAAIQQPTEHPKWAEKTTEDIRIMTPKGPMPVPVPKPSLSDAEGIALKKLSNGSFRVPEQNRGAQAGVRTLALDRPPPQRPEPPQPKKPRRLGRVASLAAAVLLGVIGFFVFWSDQGADTPPPMQFAGYQAPATTPPASNAMPASAPTVLADAKAATSPAETTPSSTSFPASLAASLAATWPTSLAAAPPPTSDRTIEDSQEPDVPADKVGKYAVVTGTKDANQGNSVTAMLSGKTLTDAIPRVASKLTRDPKAKPEPPKDPAPPSVNPEPPGKEPPQATATKAPPTKKKGTKRKKQPIAETGTAAVTVTPEAATPIPTSPDVTPEVAPTAPDPSLVGLNAETAAADDTSYMPIPSADDGFLSGHGYEPPGFDDGNHGNPLKAKFGGHDGHEHCWPMSSWQGALAP